MNIFFSMRKMLAFWFLLITLIMMFLAWAGVDGLISYGNVIDDLEFSVKGAPRRSDLVVAINQLIEPLLRPVPEGEKKLEAFALDQEKSTYEAYLKTRDGFTEFQAGFQKMPQTSEWFGSRDIITQLLYKMEESFKVIEPEIKGLGESQHTRREMRIYTGAGAYSSGACNENARSRRVSTS